MKFKPEELTNN